MKVMIELPKVHYDRLRLALDPTSRMYIRMTNGCIETRKTSGVEIPIVQFLCNRREAEALVELARQINSGAVNAIEDALKAAETNSRLRQICLILLVCFFSEVHAEPARLRLKAAQTASRRRPYRDDAFSPAIYTSPPRRGA